MNSSASRQTAFVAGASGFTGRALVHELRREGIDTIAHIRPDSSKLEILRSEFEAVGASVDTTPWTQDALNTRLQQLSPTWVFALLGTTQKRRRAMERAGKDPNAGSYEAVDLGLTIMLYDAAANSKAERFIYLSSSGVQEKTRNAYLQARVKAEKHIRDGTMAYTIARPCIISGDRLNERRPLEELGAVVGDAMLGVIGLFGAKTVQERYRSTTDRILAHNLFLLAKDPNQKNQIVESENLRAKPPT